MPTQDDPYIASLKAEIEELQARIDHSVAIKRKVNRDVLQELHEMSGNPNEHYIPPVTLARRAVKAEARVVQLQAIIDKYPKTAEGVPMVYGDQVWWWEDNAVQRGIWRGIGCEGAQVETLVGLMCWPLIEWLYSTPEAAEAAKEK